MNKELARKVLNLLDSPDHVDTLSAYAESEIEQSHLNLEGASDLLSMARLQGEIAALKRLKKLRDTAAAAVKG